mgnify:FL=1|tara:strand:+ start:6755 stop:8776 length:2022 start_codon:yes stop_codon:yes gene_type:complete
MADGMNLKLNISGANKVQRELKQTGKAAGTMGKGMKGATGSAAGLGAMIGPQGLLVVGAAAVTGGFIVAAKAAEAMGRAYVRLVTEAVQLSEELDQIGKRSRALGDTTPEDLQKITGAFELAGVEASKTGKALGKLNESMGEGMRGTKSYTDAFDKLGLSAQTLATMPLTERLIAISGGLEKMGTQAEKAQVGSLLLGRAFKDMIVGFEGGAKGLSSLVSDIERYGIASNESVRSSEELQDGILRMNKAFFGLKVRTLEPMLDTLTGVANGFANIIVSLDDDEVNKFGAAMAELTADLAMGLLQLGATAEALTYTFEPALKSAIASMLLLSGNVADGTDMARAAFKAMGEAQDKIAASNERWMQRQIKMANSMADAIERGKMAVSIPTSGPPGAPSGAGGAGGAGGADPLAWLNEAPGAGLDLGGTFDQMDDLAFLDAPGAGLPLEEMIQESIDMERFRQEELTAIVEQGVADRAAMEQQAAGDLAGAYGGAFGAMSDMVMAFRNLSIAMMGEESKESKKAAKVMFGISQSLAIAQATVNMFDAIGKANTLGYPLSIPAMITAGATGAAQIAGIVATSIGAVGDAGLTPEMVNQAISAGHSTVMINRGEAVIDPVGTRAISEMLQQRASGEPVTVNTVLEIDGQVLGQTVDQHLIRSAERGLPYAERMRYGSR